MKFYDSTISGGNENKKPGWNFRNSYIPSLRSVREGLVRVISKEGMKNPQEKKWYFGNMFHMKMY